MRFRNIPELFFSLKDGIQHQRPRTRYGFPILSRPFFALPIALTHLQARLLIGTGTLSQIVTLCFASVMSHSKSCLTK